MEGDVALPERIAAAFAFQVENCERLGSPFTARLCRLLPGALKSRLRAAVAGWAGDAAADALALRLTGGLHALAREGSCPALTAAYPPGQADLAAGLAAAMEAHQDFLLPWLGSAPQTNEVGRSAVVLGLALTVANRTARPLELLEIGASAGLNLGFDRYAYALGPAGNRGGPSPVRIACDWRGTPPAGAVPEIVARAGCDIAPIDPGDSAQRERLLAYIWPDQTERLARAEAALALTAKAPWRVERAEAAEWVEARLARPRIAGAVRLLFHTIMWQYLPEASKTRIRAALDRAGAEAGPDRPLAWARMEADRRSDSAVVLLTLWPGGITETLGRADFHGRWAEWEGRAAP
ncbi:MAG TPA: DUF2332 family protein [Paracoccaceae bacterium]|nr:DUF2332 family protein [Paracoccaceae bacterium]